MPLSRIPDVDRAPAGLLLSVRLRRANQFHAPRQRLERVGRRLRTAPPCLLLGRGLAHEGGSARQRLFRAVEGLP